MLYNKDQRQSSPYFNTVFNTVILWRHNNSIIISEQLSYTFFQEDYFSSYFFKWITIRSYTRSSGTVKLTRFCVN